jgi:hypothetical protein
MAHTRLADRRGPRAGMLEQRGVLVRVGAYSMDIWPLDRHGTSTRSHGGAGATAEMARLKKGVRGRRASRAVTAWEGRRCSINDSGFADDEVSGQRGPGAVGKRGCGRRQGVASQSLRQRPHGTSAVAYGSYRFAVFRGIWRRVLGAQRGGSAENERLAVAVPCESGRLSLIPLAGILHLRCLAASPSFAVLCARGRRPHQPHAPPPLAHPPFAPRCAPDIRSVRAAHPYLAVHCLRIRLPHPHARTLAQGDSAPVAHVWGFPLLLALKFGYGPLGLRLPPVSVDAPAPLSDPEAATLLERPHKQQTPEHAVVLAKQHQ